MGLRLFFLPRSHFGNKFPAEQLTKKGKAPNFDKERNLKQLKMKGHTLQFDEEHHLKQLKMKGQAPPSIWQGTPLKTI